MTSSKSATLADLSAEILGSIEMLVEAVREKPALILLYSAMDILGAVDSADGLATRDSFVAWSERCMQPATNLGCSGLEL